MWFLWLLLTLYNFGFMVLQYTKYGQTSLCVCTEISGICAGRGGALHKDLLVWWKYRTGLYRERCIALPDLYLYCQTLLKIDKIPGYHAVPGQEQQEQCAHDYSVSQYLTDTEGQVNCFTPIPRLSKCILLLSPTLFISPWLYNICNI